MSSMSRSAPDRRPYSKQSGGLEKGRRPLTRGTQRGYYSEIVGSDASQKIGVRLMHDAAMKVVTLQAAR